MLFFLTDPPVWVVMIWYILLYWAIGLVVDYYKDRFDPIRMSQPPSAAIVFWPALIVIVLVYNLLTGIRRFHEWIFE